MRFAEVIPLRTLSNTDYNFGVKLNPNWDGESPTLFYIFELPPQSAGIYESVKINFRGNGKTHIYAGPTQVDFNGSGYTYTDSGFYTISLNSSYLESKAGYAELKVGFEAYGSETFNLDYVEVEYSINTQNKWLAYSIREREAARVLDATADIIGAFGSADGMGINIEPYFTSVVGNINRPGYIFESLATTYLAEFSELASVGFECLGILSDAEMLAISITNGFSYLDTVMQYSSGFYDSFGSTQWPLQTADNIRLHADYLRTLAGKWIEFGKDGELTSAEVSQLQGYLQDAQNRLIAPSYANGTAEGNVQAFIWGWKYVNSYLGSNPEFVFNNWIEPAIYGVRGALWYDCSLPGARINFDTQKSFIPAYAASLAATGLPVYHSVTASAGANGTVSPTSAEVLDGDNQQFIANPNSGYEVDQWTKDGVVVQNGGTNYTMTNASLNHSITVTFKQLIGNLTVSIFPQGAIDDGAKWRVDGGTWRSSGDTEPDLAIGSHLVEYLPINLWNAPSDDPVQINADQTTSIAGQYTIRANINSDSYINLIDFSILANRWQDMPCIEPGWCEQSDIDKSGVVDMADLRVLCENWLAYIGP